MAAFYNELNVWHVVETKWNRPIKVTARGLHGRLSSSTENWEEPIASYIWHWTSAYAWGMLCEQEKWGIHGFSFQGAYDLVQ